MADETFTCRNCGQVTPVREMVRVPIAHQILSLLPFGPVPAQVCRACTGQVGFAVAMGAIVMFVATLFVLYWLVG